MPALSIDQINDLKSRFRGYVLTKDDGHYDHARKIWNGMFDKRPALIAQCVTTNDVIQAVNFSRENNLLVAVKGGGHNSAGKATCDDGIVIDLSLMRRVYVDAKNKTARVDGGALLGDVDNETQLHGLAVSAGVVSHTGVGGLALGGGFGWISRKHGFSVDNLVSADVVTANGDLVRASQDENQDLFWGLRGGGGNFGVVTSFNFNCAEIGTEIYSGIIAKKFENAQEYISFHQEYVQTLPDEMTVWLVVRKAPPLPFLPEDVHGQLVVLIPFAWLGDQAEGEKLIEPLRAHTVSHGEHIGMNPWVGWQSLFDGLAAHGVRNYWKSHHLKDLSTGCVDQILAFAQTFPSDDCEVFIPHMGGKPSRVAPTETAFAHRNTPFVLNIHTRWRNSSDDERCLVWAREFHEGTNPYAQGVYVNFLSEEGEERVKDAYTEEVWNRLVELKSKYDPTNLFHLNQNIKPSS